MQGFNDLLHGGITQAFHLGQQIDRDAGITLLAQLLLRLIQNPGANPVDQHGKQRALQLAEGFFRHPDIFQQFINGSAVSG